jgi:ketosteroid isomerase-like protein
MSDLIVAESQIRQLHSRYVDAIWRWDADSYGDCWAHDAEWKMLGNHLRGREEIVSSFRNWSTLLERVIQFYHTPIIEIRNGVVTGRTYITEHNRFKDGTTADTVGIYYERYVDDGDRWRFTWRHWNLYCIGAPDMSGTLFDIPDYGPPPNMPCQSDQAMPSYELFENALAKQKLSYQK